ncbi:MAG: hypothetical protein MJ162_05850 [Treponema sp.]|nr:hypothetical protein [Treponema sp.]
MVKNCIKKALVFVVAVSLSVSALFAKEVILGGKNGWNDLQTMDNVAVGKGRYGYDCMEIATNAFKVDEYTDLLINFEDNKTIAYGAYDVISNNLRLSTESKMDKYAGLCRNTGGLAVSGRPGTFFGSQGILGSFTIEFWLCPSISENGETILNWESSKNVNNRLVYQMLNCSFSGGKLEWILTNFFDGFTNAPSAKEVKMKGTTNIIPNTWSYHVLSYDCENGELLYLVNGETEAIKYITANGKEGGETTLVSLGVPSEVAFCSEYTGKIDDIRITRRPYTTPHYQTPEAGSALQRFSYEPRGGRFETAPVMVSTGSVLNSLTAEYNTPAETDVAFFVRSGDNYFNWTDSYPEWKAIDINEPLTGITGMYFQLACELYPDGAGTVTPSVTQIKMDFSEIPLPLPPFLVKAEAGYETITLTWSYSVDDTAGGYYVYYGSRSGEYLGRFAVQGDSPIKAGNTNTYTFTGLKNGKICYFAVAAWSALDDRIIGPLSKEVYARPLDRLEK